MTNLPARNTSVKPKKNKKPLEEIKPFIPQSFWETHMKMADKLGKDYKKYWVFW